MNREKGRIASRIARHVKGQVLTCLIVVVFDFDSAGTRISRAGQCVAQGFAGGGIMSVVEDQCIGKRQDLTPFFPCSMCCLGCYLEIHGVRLDG